MRAKIQFPTGSLNYDLGSSSAKKMKQRAAQVVENVGSAEALGKVLDVAAGDNGFIRALRRQGVKDAIGVDPNPRIKTKSPRHFVLADGTKLPFGDATFDTVTCFNYWPVLGGSAYGEALPKEVLRVLKPNGRLIIYTPKKASYLNNLREHYGLQAKNSAPTGKRTLSLLSKPKNWNA